MSELKGQVLAVVREGSARTRIGRKLPHYKILFADASTAADTAARSRPDVIVAEAGLPGDDGFRMVKELAGSEILWVDVAAAPGRPAPAGTCTVEQLPNAITGYFRRRKIFAAVREAVDRASAEVAIASAAFTPAEQEVLQSGGFPMAVPLAVGPVAARAAKYQAILDRSLSVEEAAKRLGVTTGRIRQRLLADPPTLYGIRDGHVWRLPAFQFASKRLIPNVEQVIARLDPALDPVAVLNWFTQPNVDLEQGGQRVSPLDWLAQGHRAEPVLELAGNL
jgi:hypothetical protein